jgi:nicotinamidase-related amidase
MALGRRKRDGAQCRSDSPPALHGVQTGGNDGGDLTTPLLSLGSRLEGSGSARTVPAQERNIRSQGPYTLDGFEHSGADFLPNFKKYINDGKTIICSPHKLYGPRIDDLSFQLRKQRVDQIVLTGMLANMCVESHLREFLEQGFEVAVVRDAIAAPKIPDGDGYLSALINFRYMANGL